jgi:hypothetical protein
MRHDKFTDGHRIQRLVRGSDERQLRLGPAEATLEGALSLAKTGGKVGAGTRYGRHLRGP